MAFDNWSTAKERELEQRTRSVRGADSALPDTPPLDVRVSSTGATRNPDTDKFDIEGFFHPEVLHVYAGYMHDNRHQRNGQFRDSDNWQLGLPGGKAGIMKSLLRHAWDLWRLHRQPDLLITNPDRPGKPFTRQTLCCAVIFGAMAYLYETLVENGMPRGREPNMGQPGERIVYTPHPLRPVPLSKDRVACPRLPGEAPGMLASHCLTPAVCLHAGICRRVGAKPGTGPNDLHLKP